MCLVACMVSIEGLNFSRRNTIQCQGKHKCTLGCCLVSVLALNWDRSWDIFVSKVGRSRRIKITRLLRRVKGIQPESMNSEIRRSLGNTFTILSCWAQLRSLHISPHMQLKCSWNIIDMQRKTLRWKCKTTLRCWIIRKTCQRRHLLMQNIWSSECSS